jgi:hypothetical protein
MLSEERGALERQITDTALEYRLVSAYTSFVAVDNQVVSRDGKPRLVAQPVEMPQGVSREGVFGDAKHAAMAGGALQSLVGGVMPAVPPSMGSRGAPMARPSFSVQEKVEPQPSRPLPVPSRPAPSAPCLEARLEAERAAVRVGDAIRVRIVVRNTSPAAVEVPAQLDLHAGVELRVALDGRDLPARRREPRAASGSVRLQPGKERTYLLTLSGAGGWSFAQPGRYEIVLTQLGKLGIAPARCTLTVRG